MTHDEIAQVMTFLYSQRAPSLPASALAEVFDRLIWCMADQGAGLLLEREYWLRSEEKGRVEIALAMDETYPFGDISEMEMVFAKISERWPDLKPRCADLLEARRNAEG